MSGAILEELRFFALAVLRGVLILIVYDVIRIFRRVVSHGVWAVAVEDLFYWMATALLVFELLYRENDGAVRGYALFAVAAGMLFYHQTVSGWLMEHIAGILRLFFGILLAPLRFLLRKIRKFLKLTGRFHKKKLKNQLKECIVILLSK
ncbi:MAG: spore cortex biosynthesis protein YabQ [Lachnospiraceae bacterium]|nr:spore cortex biosynthesis protein YabQ [Lachnospiraceae bacterium]